MVLMWQAWEILSRALNRVALRLFDRELFFQPEKNRQIGIVFLKKDGDDLNAGHYAQLRLR